MSKFNNILIGCDPEFVFTKNDQIKSMQTLLRSLNPNVEWMNEQFGYDAHGITGEIRPAPSANVYELLDNIKGCFRHGVSICPEIIFGDLLAGSMRFGEHLGGHIHIATNQSKKLANNTQVLMYILNMHIAYPLALLDSKDDADARHRRGYGTYGNNRIQEWGLEWRTPYSWLCDETLAGGVLAATKVIVQEFQRTERLDKIYGEFNHSLIQAYFDDHAVEEIVRFVKDFRPLDRLSKMELFKEYESLLVPMYEMAFRGEMRVNSTGNILTTWKGILPKNIVDLLEYRQMISEDQLLKLIGNSGADLYEDMMAGISKSYQAGPTEDGIPF